MATVTQHAPGTFCWPECATSDANAAKTFYTSLFGWQFQDNDMGPGGTYTIFKKNGSDVAALYTITPQMGGDMPPCWNSYVSVESVDAAAEKVKALGGKVIMEPMDVMEHGRMAVCQDPQGAMFNLWQPKQHVGSLVLNEPNSLGWTQLNATDTAKAKPFYTSLFGWRVQDDPMPAEMGGGHYTTFLKADGMAGGMMAMPPGTGAPSHWLVYWAVDDVDQSHAKATSLGAKSMVPPTDIPGTGRFSVLADPQGATFSLIKFKM